MKCNRLALSISKTNFILFHSSKLKPNQSLRIKIDDTPIKQVDSTKYLGITFDSNLTWKSHINELCLKLSKTVGILSKVRHFVNKHILVMQAGSYPKFCSMKRLEEYFYSPGWVIKFCNEKATN